MGTRQKTTLSAQNLISILKLTPTYEKAVKRYLSNATKDQLDLHNAIHQSSRINLFDYLQERYGEPTWSDHPFKLEYKVWKNGKEVTEAKDISAKRKPKKDRYGKRNAVKKYQYDPELLTQLCHRLEPNLANKNEREFFLLYGDILPVPIDLSSEFAAKAFERFNALNRVRVVTGDFCLEFSKLLSKSKTVHDHHSPTSFKDLKPNKTKKMTERLSVIHLVAQSSSLMLTNKNHKSRATLDYEHESFQVMSVLLNNDLTPEFYQTALGVLFRDNLKKSRSGSHFYLDNSKYFNWRFIPKYLHLYQKLLATPISASKKFAFVSDPQNQKYITIPQATTDLEKLYDIGAQRGKELVDYFTRQLP